jgi:two-component system cell cycle sensor histidine kinase/response regulator CckA
LAPEIIPPPTGGSVERANADVRPSRTHLERDLLESERRYRLLAEHVSDVIWTMDLGGVIQYVSPSIEKLRGYRPEEIVGWRLEQVMAPESAERCLEALERELAREGEADADPRRSVTLELEQRRKDGSTLWVEIVATLLRDERGEVTGVLGVSRDITRRHRAEEEREHHWDRRDKQQSVIVRLGTHETIWSGDFDRAVRIITELVSEAMDVERVSVWLANEAVDELRCLDLFVRTGSRHERGAVLSSRDYPAYFEALRAQRVIDAHDAYADPRTAEFCEGYLRPNEIASMLDSTIRVSGRVLGVVCHEQVEPARTWHLDEIAFAGEVADQLAQAYLNAQRLETAAALRRSEEKYRALMDDAADAILLADRDGNILEGNRRAAELLGYAVAEIPGLTVPRLHPEPEYDRIVRAFRSIVETGSGRVDGTQVLRKDGSVVSVDIAARVVEVQDGVVVQGVFRDITDRLELERQLYQAQKMEAIGQLAGGVAHDFNNMLAPILGYAELLLAKLPPDDASRAALEEIRRAAERSRDLTSRLLVLGRKQELRVRSLDPNDVVRGLEAMLRRTLREDIELCLSLTEEPGFVRADAGQLEQVLMNLALNAQDAMPRGGVLRLKTELAEIVEGGNGRHLDVPPGSYVVLAVQDDGVGMDASIRDRVFEPFFTTKKAGEGTGLGLATVYGIVRQHDGCIRVRSAPGRGSTFRVYLPRVDDPPTPATPLESETSVRGGSETVVVVEDEDMVRELVQSILEAYGYEVEAPADARECLSLFRAGKLRADLLLTDVVMPDMNGRELRDALRETHPDLRVLFMSGYPGDRILEADLNEAHAAFLAKPFRGHDLARKVRAVLDA